MVQDYLEMKLIRSGFYSLSRDMYQTATCVSAAIQCSPSLCLHLCWFQKMDRLINNLTEWWKSKRNPSLLLFRVSFYTTTTSVMVSSIEIEYEQFSKGHGSVWVTIFLFVTVEISERTLHWGVSEWHAACNCEALSATPTWNLASLSIWGIDLLLALSRSIICCRCDASSFILKF